MRDARLALGMSQGQVARATGVSRSQLSLFEGRKYLLDRGKLAALRKYFTKRGYRFNDASHHPRVLNPTAPPRDSGATIIDQTDIDLLDGFVVAGGIDRARAEAWLDQIAANDDVTEELLVVPTTTDFWTGDPKTDDRDEVLLQMARNYALVRRLHGKEILPAPGPAKEKVTLTGDFGPRAFLGEGPKRNRKSRSKVEVVEAFEAQG
ncbi:MAG TPA: helix-turn-helix transcriptional regulator [Casimicrobiaceae bacterium]